MLLLSMQLLNMAGGGAGPAASLLPPYDKLSIGLRISLSSWVLAFIIKETHRLMELFQ